MDIHITRKGEQHGPYPEANAREMLAAGQLLPTDLAWHAGADGWKPLGEVLGAATQPPATPPPSPPPAGGGTPKRTVAGTAPAEEKPAEEKPEDSEPDDPDKISVTRNGEPIGPYSREKAKEYFASGQLLPTDWGWHDGMDDWKPINEVLGMAAPAQTAAAAGQQPMTPGKRPSTPLSGNTKLILMGAGGLLVLSIIARWVPFIGNLIDLVCLFGGLGLILGYNIVLLFKAFEKSVLWGLGCLCLGLPALVFIIMHWEDTKEAFFGMLTGFAVWAIIPLFSSL